MEWMFMPFRRYADFTGRSRRKEYWMFALLNLIIMIPFYVIILGSASAAMATGGQPGVGAGSGIVVGSMLVLVYALVAFLPSLAVTVRRLHDQEKSGWFFLLAFVPFVGGIVLLVFMLLDGTKGPNRYGADPKGAETPAI